jgi:ribonucleoside-triphosphate reductase (thioredoxin)
MTKIDTSLGIRALSDTVVFDKYARFLPALGRRETWEEICFRYLDMMSRRYPAVAEEVWDNAGYLLDKKVLMSMRMAQFAGPAVEKNESRGFNCSYLPIDHPYAFAETMFLLLSGCGVGFSVQQHHISCLPEINKGKRAYKFLVSDNIEGWADAVKALMYWGFGKRKTRPVFDYSDIRPKGARLITAGGKAPGPEPLKRALIAVERILDSKADGSRLSDLEVHDIVCHIADAVRAGGIRRAALISLFSRDSDAMITAKSGTWWVDNPQRGRANNSAVLPRKEVTEEEFRHLWRKVEASGAGEPGLYWVDNINILCNPCAEISLRAKTFCNLTEINGAGCNTQHELRRRAEVAAFFGTLQAGFTDFHYLRPEWRKNTEEDALIGVGITGICNGDILNLNLAEAAKAARVENRRVAGKIGINPAARVTTVKPAGTTSCLLGVSSGIHAWHSKYYVRNIQTKVGSVLYEYFTANHPEMVTIMEYDPSSAVIGFPLMAPESAILRDGETAITMMERVKRFNLDWVRRGHRSGDNTNNVSATVSIKPEEWQEVGEWMWENRDTYNGLSVLPFDGGTYKNAPFEECSEAEFCERLKHVEGVDLTRIKEEADNTEQANEVACAGGSCEVVTAN